MIGLIALYFNVPFVGAYNFYWKLDMLYQVIETELNKLLMWEVVLTQFEIGLCLMFSVTIDVRVFKLF